MAEHVAHTRATPHAAAAAAAAALMMSGTKSHHLGEKTDQNLITAS